MPEPERRPPWPSAHSDVQFDAGGSFLQHVYFGGGTRDSITKPSLSPGEIFVSAVVATNVDNTTIVAVSESTARAEAEAFLPFNFSASWRTCIYRV